MRHNPSIMQHAFSRVPKVSLPRSVFNRSHGYKSSFDADWLIPFYVDEVLPGDTFNLKTTFLVRLQSPALRPFMDNCWVDTFFFFVPNRLLWTNFKKFMGEQDNPADSISFTVPQITGPNVAGSGIPIGHLYDYMGLPVGPLSGGGATTGVTFNNLHGRAYNLIWNTWFRDQNLQNAVTIDVGDGPDTFANYNLLKRGKRHDYFTSCLPNPQRGSTAVTLPLGTTAPLIITGAPTFDGVSGSPVNSSMAATIGTGAMSVSAPAATQTLTWHSPGLQADLTNASAATLNSLRQSITLQQFLERDARGGTRYPELIVSHFGVTNPDSRVQRPELLSTSSTRLNLSPVANTAGDLTDSSNSNNLGSLAAFGTSSMQNGFTKSFSEHGVLLGIVSVRADLSYTQGMDRMWSRRTRYDFFWPTFANLGEQAVLNREIFADLADGTGAAAKDGTFGYIPRYDEYRFKNSKITSNMRSYNGHGVNASKIDVWHLAEAFSTQPTLSATFIQSAVPLDRCIVFPNAEHFLVDTFIDLKCARVMPVFAVPGLNKL